MPLKLKFDAIESLIKDDKPKGDILNSLSDLKDTIMNNSFRSGMMMNELNDKFLALEKENTDIKKRLNDVESLVRPRPQKPAKVINHLNDKLLAMLITKLGVSPEFFWNLFSLGNIGQVDTWCSDEVKNEIWMEHTGREDTPVNALKVAFSEVQEELGIKFSASELWSEIKVVLEPLDKNSILF